MATFGSKRPIDDSCQTPPSKKAKIAKKSPVRNFNESWKDTYPWVRFDKEAKLMCFDPCIKIQIHLRLEPPSSKKML